MIYAIQNTILRSNNVIEVLPNSVHHYQVLRTMMDYKPIMDYKPMMDYKHTPLVRDKFVRMYVHVLAYTCYMYMVHAGKSRGK